MSLYDEVDREALHDWLDELPALRADARPDPSEYEDRGGLFDDDGESTAGSSRKGPSSADHRKGRS